MHDLRLVGVHDDGEHLLLSGADGEQYLLAVDEPLRAAVRRDRAHLGQLQIQMSGDLRPREVQAQIRAGATAEDVAERSGWPLDRVRRYEGAVLAEREHITGLARAVVLRRRSSEPSPPTLASRVDQRLVGRGVDARENVWDSWRPEDGPWIVSLRFSAGGREREAHWVFDLSTRTVVPQDDEALWLSEDEKPPAPPLPAPHLSAVPTVTAAGPGSVGEELYDIDAEGGMDAPESITLDAPSAVDLVDAMRQRRHHGRRRQGAEPAARRPADNESSEAQDQQHLEVEPLMFDPSLLGEPPAAHPFPFPERLREPEGGTATSNDEETEPPQDRANPVPVPRNFGPPARPMTSTPEAAGHRRSRRTSVPSWDEIMFGGRRD
jgi:Protein of unknown function (DUF3071)